MILPVVVPTRSGGRPDAAPLTDPDAPAVPAADVSKHQAAQSRRKLAAVKAGDRPAMTATAALAKPARTPKPAPARPARAPKPAAAATPAPAEAPAVAAPPTVIPSAPHILPLDRLRRSPENVRHTRIAEDVDGLADDIAAHGLLQNLIGYSGEWPEDEGRVFIVGGGRRLQALNVLRERGAIGGDFAVPVLIREFDEAVELSLAENLQQRTMSPVDEFFAFAELMKNGTNSPAGLAKRFGFTERVVKQRLRLAELAEPILDALAKRDITLDAAMAYASAQDREQQAAVFKEHAKPNAWRAHDPHTIRGALRAKGMDTSDPLYRFVGAEDYEAAGGGYEDDLFNEAGTERILSHAYLIEQLAARGIARGYQGMLAELVCRDDLAPTITGYVAIPDLRLHNWGTQAKLKAPEGFAKVDRYDHAKSWNTIRNNAIEARVVLGINPEGELAVWPKIVFVSADQKNAVDPAQPSYAYVPPDPVEEAKRMRDRMIQLWARRLAIGPFAGTPLEGRAWWPEPHQDRGKATIVDGVNGWLTTVDIFVTDAQVAAARAAAEARYEEALAEKAAREMARAEVEAAAEQRRDELLAIDPPPAVIVIDGQAWLRSDDGGYAPEGDDADPADSWTDLIEAFDLEDLGATYATRADYDAAIAEGGEA